MDKLYQELYERRTERTGTRRESRVIRRFYEPDIVKRSRQQRVWLEGTKMDLRQSLDIPYHIIDKAVKLDIPSSFIVQYEKYQEMKAERSAEVCKILRRVFDLPQELIDRIIYHFVASPIMIKNSYDEYSHLADRAQQKLNRLLSLAAHSTRAPEIVIQLEQLLERSLDLAKRALQDTTILSFTHPFQLEVFLQGGPSPSRPHGIRHLEIDIKFLNGYTYELFSMQYRLPQLKNAVPSLASFSMVVLPDHSWRFSAEDDAEEGLEALVTAARGVEAVEIRLIFRYPLKKRPQKLGKDVVCSEKSVQETVGVIMATVGPRGTGRMPEALVVVLASRR